MKSKRVLYDTQGDFCVGGSGVGREIYGGCTRSSEKEETDVFFSSVAQRLKSFQRTKKKFFNAGVFGTRG